MIICMWLAVLCVVVAVVMEWYPLMALASILFTISEIRYSQLKERLKELELTSDFFNTDRWEGDQ